MKGTIKTVFKAVAVAMGVAVIVLGMLKMLPSSTGLLLLGIGVVALGIASLQD